MAADRAALDRETFQALLDRYGVSERVQRFIMHPYVKNLSYARPDLVSAAAACDAIRVLRHHEGFSLFAPGDAERAPSVAADDRPNLFFAGDWVRSDVRSWYMGRAAVTGVEAANHVLAREGYPVRTLLEGGETSVLPKLVGLPFRATDAIRRAYRSVVD